MSVPGVCDAETPTSYFMTDGTIGCRCIVCSRCGHHTGNSTQGHYWRFCSATNEMLDDWHLCCPGDCELASRKAAS